MSRIGKLPVVLPDNVEVKIADNKIEIKWPLWTLTQDFSTEVSLVLEDGKILVTPNSQEPLALALWGTTRANINNMVIWVTEWYTKSLEINWVWYKFEVSWDKLILSIGYSHKVEMPTPAGLTVKMDEKLKNVIHISWINKQQVWEYASKIKYMKKPEPYKGKWIKYVWEVIKRKAWKSGK